MADQADTAGSQRAKTVRLEGRVAIVTGAGSGIGRATARRLASEGAAVTVADIDEQAAQRVAAEIEAAGGAARAQVVDVAEEDQVAAMVADTVAAFGRLDVLHNNAASLGPQQLHGDRDVIGMDAGLWDQVMAVNLRGPMLGCKHAVPHLLDQGGGSIVNTASVAALGGSLVRTAYGVSKAGLIALTKYVATAYGKQGVRCNAVAPGVVVTEKAQDLLTRTPEQAEIFRSNHLTPRLGEPDDIAATVAFLASDESAYLTGQLICVDGGYTAHTPTYAQDLARVRRREEA